MDMVINGKNYMVFELSKSMTRDNRPYLRSVVIDKAGNQYQGIMFDTNKLDFEPEKGDVVCLSGTLQNYNGQMQLKISQMQKVEGDDFLDFLPKSQFDPEDMFAELKALLTETVVSTDYANLLNAFLNDNETIDKFMKMPAAKTVHHAYVSGLLEHTLGVVKLACQMAEPYKNRVDLELLLMGALFHDLGKVLELDVNRGFDYTDSGKLLGHLVLGIEMIAGYTGQLADFPMQKKMLLQHLIASHHGITEFGALKKPKTIEALILHHADDLDAKINTFETIYEKENIDSGWSSYDRILERQIYKHI